ncbi:MAG: 3'(2'),5'-bisphosphate nucleotidase CysQ [Holosporales bacterium]|jgi:3'(2'), 5'-bisphosphate nucleotidase
MLDVAALATALLPAVDKAGRAILSYYKRDVAITRKDDNSPTTAADAEAEAILIEALTTLTPDIAIVAEEACAHGTPTGMGATFWLVDPLDGTKEFLKGTDEFTVNVALIKDGVPVLGIVAAPALGETFVGYDGHAVKYTDTAKTLLKINSDVQLPYRVLTSRSHHDREDVALLMGDRPVGEVMAVGSSLKFCRLAEGAGDIYPRLGTTMEWDTAAGDAVLRAAGGSVNNPDGSLFVYNKPGFRNGAFLAKRGGVA